MLMSALVTRDNAKVLLMQGEELMRQADRLDQLHDKADNYLHKLDTQRVVNWLAVSIIILLLVVFILFYLYYLKKVNMQRERVVNTLWNLKPEDIPVSSKQTEDMESAVISDETEEKEPVAVSQFIIRFKEVIEAPCLSNIAYHRQECLGGGLCRWLHCPQLLH